MRLPSGLLAFSLFTVGCSGVSDSPGIALSPGTPGAGGSSIVAGRAALDVPFADAEVEVFAPDGRLLATARTQRDGTYQVPVDPAPRDFRVVVSGRPPGAPGPEAYAADYRNFDVATRGAVVTPLTNLLAVYRDRHPEVSEADARRRIGGYFQLKGPESVENHLVQGGRRRGFSVRKYLQAARAQGAPSRARFGGGAATFAAGLVERIHAGQAQTAAENLSDDPNFNWESAASTWGTAATDFGLILGGFKEAAPAGELVGWLLGFLVGGGNPVAAELAEIQTEIQGLISAVSSLPQAIVSLQQLETASNQVQTAYNEYQAFAQSQATASDFINAITSNNLPNALTTIHSTLAAPVTGVAAELTVKTNQAAQAAYQGFDYGPMLGHFSFTDALTDFGAFWASRQTQAMQMLMEQSHAQTAPTPPDVAGALSSYDQFCRHVTEQRTLLPRPLASDQVIYNPRCGLLFYAVIQPPATVQASQSMAANATTMGLVGPYSGWRVMQLQDITAWLQVNDNVVNGAQANSGITATQMQAWGFDTTNLELDDSATSVALPYLGVQVAGGDQYPGERYYLGSIGSGQFEYHDGDDPTDTWPLGGHWTDDYQMVYTIVADAATQDPALIPALGNLTSPIQVTATALPAGGYQLQATGNFTVNQVNGDTFSIDQTTVANVDITDLVLWTTAGPGARVQNYPSGAQPTPSPGASPSPQLGYVGPFAPGVVSFFYNQNSNQNVTVTATYPGLLNFQTPTNMTGSLTLAPNAPVPQVQGVQLLIPTNTVLTQAGAKVSLTATAYLSDGTTQDVTTNTSTAYTVTPAGVANVDNGNVVLLGASGTGTFNLAGSFGGKTGNVTVNYDVP